MIGAAHDSALVELRTRAIALSTEREAWLRARAKGVTATEVNGLRTKGAAYTRELLAAKAAGGLTQDLSHVPHIRWGQLREVVIGEWIRDRFGIEPNATLFHGENPRHLATPDGTGVNWDGELVLSEIKTSKYDLNPQIPDGHYYHTPYYDQKQWQLWVTGAQRCLFVWEGHDSDWSQWPRRGPIPWDEPQFMWFDRDEERIRELVTVGDRFLERLDMEQK